MAGDGASYNYKDAGDRPEHGLEETLQRINEHLGELHDEATARSLKRRASTLAENIRAEIIRQADLMLELARLDDALKRKLALTREAGDSSAASAEADLDALIGEGGDICDDTEVDEEDCPNQTEMPKATIAQSCSGRSLSTDKPAEESLGNTKHKADSGADTTGAHLPVKKQASKPRQTLRGAERGDADGTAATNDRRAHAQSTDRVKERKTTSTTGTGKVSVEAAESVGARDGAAALKVIPAAAASQPYYLSTPYGYPPYNMNQGNYVLLSGVDISNLQQQQQQPQHNATFQTVGQTTAAVLTSGNQQHQQQQAGFVTANAAGGTQQIPVTLNTASLAEGTMTPSSPSTQQQQQQQQQPQQQILQPGQTLNLNGVPLVFNLPTTQSGTTATSTFPDSAAQSTGQFITGVPIQQQQPQQQQQQNYYSYYGYPVYGY